MGDEHNRRTVHYDPCQVKCDPCYDQGDSLGAEREEDGWEWGSSLILLLVILLLCGGTSWFGGANDCCEGSSSGSLGCGNWILIIIVIYFLFQGSKGGRGGFNLF